MDIVCPNPNHPDWKNLVKELGDNPEAVLTAHLAFIRNKGEIPTAAKAKELVPTITGIHPDKANEIMGAFHVPGETWEQMRSHMNEYAKSSGVDASGSNQDVAGRLVTKWREFNGKTQDQKMGPNVAPSVDNAIGDNTAAQVGTEEPLHSTRMAGGKNFQKMQENTTKQILDSQKWDWVDFKNKILDYFVGPESKLLKYLEGNPYGEAMLVAWRNARGSAGAAAVRFEDLKKSVYAEMPKKWKPVLNGYLEARRIIELAKMNPKLIFPEGLKHGDAEAWINEVKGLYGEDFQKIEKAAEKVWAEMRKTIDLYYEKGLHSKELHDWLVSHHKEYTPFEVMDYLDNQVPFKKADGTTQMYVDSGIKKLDSGSKRYINNDWESYTAHAIARREGLLFKNEANKALVAYAKGIGPENPLGIKFMEPKKGDDGLPATDKYRQFIYDEPPPGEMAIPYYEKGQKYQLSVPIEVGQNWALSDPLLQQSWVKWLELMSGTKFLKWMATGGNPEFGFTNIIKDLALYTFANPVYSRWVPVGYAQIAGDLIATAGSVWRRTGIAKEFLTEGGGMEFLSQAGSSTFMDDLEKMAVGKEAVKIAAGLNHFNSTMEIWTRIALMRRLMMPKEAGGAGMTKAEAIAQARHVADFSHYGPATKMLDKIAIPYLNPAVQITRTVVQAFKKDPKRSMALAAQYAAIGATLTYFNRLMHGAAWDDVSDREKESKWIFTMPMKLTDANGKTRYPYIALPKDQAFRMFSTIGDQMTEKAMTGKVNMNQLTTSLTDAIPVDDVGSIPPTLKAFLSYSLNMDFWNKVPAWKGREVPAPLEYTSKTPKIAVLWGKTSGMSPERTTKALSNLLPMNPWTWMLGGAADMVLPDDPVLHKMAYEELLNIPGLRKYIRLTNPIDLTENDTALAKSLKVDTTNPDGSPRSARQVKNEIQEANVSRGGLRQELDNELDRHIIEAKLAGTRKPIDEFLMNIPDAKERTRLNVRLKNRARDVWMLK